MSALAKILTKTISNVVKNTAKLELSVDDLIGRFQNSCPPKEDILQIVKQKNQLQSALENVVGAFTKLESTLGVTQTTIITIETAVKIIKAIPIPTTPTPIPLNVITILSDSLDKLGLILRGSKGALALVPTVSQTVIESSNLVLGKLQQLDLLLNNCIGELAEGMTQAEKNNLISEIGNVAATSGNFNDGVLNLVDEKDLEERLSINSSNPYLYQKTGFKTADWRFILEYNQDNEFDFPQRRIRVENINNSEENIYRGVVVYNVQGQEWSYSNSIKILVEEAKFIVEQLDNRFWARANENYTPN